jgi:putative transposase
VTWPQQLAYELIRPVVLFGQAVAKRARETGGASRTIHRKANRFDAYGMASLFADFTAPKQTDRRSLPPHLQQLIVDRKTEYPAFHLRELATLCYVADGQREARHADVRRAGPNAAGPSRQKHAHLVYGLRAQRFVKNLAASDIRR